jgi:hypothetical protein
MAEKNNTTEKPFFQSLFEGIRDERCDLNTLAKEVKPYINRVNRLSYIVFDTKVRKLSTEITDKIMEKIGDSIDSIKYIAQKMAYKVKMEEAAAMWVKRNNKSEKSSVIECHTRSVCDNYIKYNKLVKMIKQQQEKYERHQWAILNDYLKENNKKYQYYEKAAAIIRGEFLKSPLRDIYKYF